MWRFKEVELSNGERYKVWIEYRDFNVLVIFVLEVVMKFKKFLIVVQLDFFEVFFENMYVGFVGVMGCEVECYDIWSWNFQNSVQNI